MHHSVPIAFAVVMMCGVSNPLPAQEKLISNPNLNPRAEGELAPDGFEIVGDAVYGNLDTLQRENSGWGVRLLAGEDVNGDGQHAGAMQITVPGITATEGRWFRLSIRALAQEDFHVDRDSLWLKVEFWTDEGRTSLDHIEQTIFPQVELDRQSLRDSGTNRNLGPATWRTFVLEFRTPFPEIDTLRLSAGFSQGRASGKQSEFWINEFDLVRIPEPSTVTPTALPEKFAAALDSLRHLGGRWYFDPRGGDDSLPSQFDDTNADQLLYRSDRLIAPFAGNMTSWLRSGYLNRAGAVVEEAQLISDNVVITLSETHLVMRSKNLPNHPTAKFPDRWRALDGNPNHIGEQDFTWYLPLEPRQNPNARAMHDQNNNDRALPMGPIGVAINGVVFFNPFDHLLDEDAVWRLDRCCGHPAPQGLYHYHKYPVCLKSPWSDDGQAHSPVIGFAFDGYPVYGPYESAGELARLSEGNPLNEFNVHYDEQRGWHYHVTPGAFPHIIGGYWGVVESKNLRRPGPRGRPPE